ncbi:MAG: DMT family transporter [Velocimicrobium sp.]
MYYLLTIIGGILTTSMIAINGELTSWYGVYLATVMIHLIGLIPLSVMVKIKHVRLKLPKELPIYYFLGGVIGVGTTICNNIAYGAIGVSAIMALGLLGQSITSILIDEFGLFGMMRRRFNKKKIVGFIFVCMGIVLLTI